MYQSLKNRVDLNDESGFTLIELLIVIVVLGVLSAIVVFGVSGINDNSKLSACKADKKSVEIAAEAYYANSPAPHTYAADIAALVTAKFLREAPSSADYTISYSGGAVTGSIC
jgi:general secretion pathway protein G